MDWPALPYADWEPTKQTLHRYAQMVGKVRMALVPPLNHWWHATLFVSARGLRTGAMPVGRRTAEIELDFVDHRLDVRTSDGRTAGFALRERPACAHFYADLFAALDAVGVSAQIDPRPFDLGDSPPFAEDTEHDSYDADAVERFWTILRLTDNALATFRSRFVGKASPTHLFWHSFDLAHARYSGRRAPAIPGADAVTAEAYSHEVIAFGWWPGDDRRTPYPAFYSYTAPEPDGLRDRPLAPAAAAWQDTGSGSLAILPYDDVRAAADPAADLLLFFERAYRAGAEAAGWDVERRHRMKYALLIYQDAEFERSWERATDEERAALYAQFDAFAAVAGDRLLGGHELGLSGTATTLRKRDGDVVLSDGPFAEVAEHLGGYMIVEAADLDEALELARALPDGTVEVRPVAA